MMISLMIEGGDQNSDMKVPLENENVGNLDI